MKKHGTMLLLLSGMIFLLLTGCTTFYSPIPKDTVMIKKLEEKEEPKVSQIEAGLTDEAIKILSVNAVNKYFNLNLAMDDVEIGFKPIGSDDLKTTLVRETRKLNLEPEILDAYKSQLDKCSGGLYAVMIKHLFNESETFSVFINPQNGDIVNFVWDYKIVSPQIVNPTAAVDIDELTQVAKQFIEQNELVDRAYLPIDSSRLQGFINKKIYLFQVNYMSEDRQEMLCLLIDPTTKKVVSVAKDLIAALQMIESK